LHLSEKDSPKLKNTRFFKIKIQLLKQSFQENEKRSNFITNLSKNEKMKKIIFLLLLAVVVTPAAALAQEIPAEQAQCVIKFTIDTSATDRMGVNCGNAGDVCLFSDAGADCATCCAMSWVYYVSNIFFVFVIVISVLFILLAAYNFITSAGDATKVSTARSQILYAAIGIFVALLAKFFPAIVAQFVGG